MKVVDSRLTPPRSLHGKKNLSVVWTPVGRLLCKSLGGGWSGGVLLGH